MLNKKMNSFIFGLIAGIIVCFIGVFCSILPYMVFWGKLFTGFFLCALVLGCIVAVFIITHRNPSHIDMIVRFISFVCSFICCYVIGAYLGIWAWLFNLLNVHTTSSSDNVSGLMFLLYFVVVAVVSIISVQICATSKH
jgi:hypothetical protein